MLVVKELTTRVQSTTMKDYIIFMWALEYLSNTRGRGKGIIGGLGLTGAGIYKGDDHSFNHAHSRNAFLVIMIRLPLLVRIMKPMTTLP